MGKSLAINNVSSKILLLMCGIVIMSLVFSCVPSDSSRFDERQDLQRNHQLADSLAKNVQDLDSLNYWADAFVSANDEYGEMVILKAIGAYHQSKSNYIDAIEEYNRTLVLAEDLCDTLGIIESLNLLGDNLRFLGVTGQSAEHYFMALSICEAWSGRNSVEGVKNLIVSRMGIGNAQYILGNYARAEITFKLALGEEELLKNPSGQAEIYASLGKIKEMLGQPDSAFFYYEQSLQKSRYANSKAGTAMCYNHFGRLAEAKGDWDAAIRYYYRAFYIMEDEPIVSSTMESCLSLARVYLKRGDEEQALQYIDEGWELAEKTHSWRMMAQACLLQSKYDEKKGNHKAALHWFKVSNAYGDSVTNERTRMFVQKIRQEYISEHQNKELEDLRMDYTRVKQDNRAFVVWAVLAGFFAFLCIGFLLYVLKVRMRSQQLMKQMEKVRTDFFTNITHEFRTPLTVMLGLGKRIADKKVVHEEEYVQMGAMLVRQSNGLLDLVNQLLDIARAETVVSESEWRTGDISPYISMVIENCQIFAEKRNVSLAYVASERELEMDFVPEYIHKILLNLLTNAIRYSGEGGKVTVRLEQRGTKMQLFVSDTGRGVPEKDLPHMFDAFYTATNWGIEISTGVGLAMVRQMVVSMNGTIEVKSILGKGVTFVIEIPLHHGKKTHVSIGKDNKVELPDYLPAQYLDMANKPEDDLSDILKPVVLVIEDNRDIATYIGMQLSAYYRVAYAMNGKEGIAKAGELVPDLIISDLVMPIMDGYEVCRQVRQTETLRHIPIVILSAKSTEADRLKGLSVGADAYLFKPFNSDELKVVVDNLIGQRKYLRERFSVNEVTPIADNSDLKPFERDFLNKFVDVVYAQMPKGNIDPESLASIMCMSSSQLRRKILSLTGEKLTTFILQIRLKQAKMLLDAHGDMPVADVASRCGFEDAAYFSRIFKNVYQMTPSQYRKQSSLGK